MPTHRLTETEINLRINPRQPRWRPAETNTAFTALHAGSNSLRDLITAIDAACAAAESDKDLSQGGIRRRIVSLAEKAIRELDDYAPLRKAQRAVQSNIESLQSRMTDLPKPPSDIASVALAQEIRSHIKQTKSPIDFSMSHIGNAVVLSAIVNAPHFLSGLTETEQKVVHEKAVVALHPQQYEMIKDLQAAQEDLIKAHAAARRVVAERCGVEVNAEGQVHDTGRAPLQAITGRSSVSTIAGAT